MRVRYGKIAPGVYTGVYDYSEFGGWGDHSPGSAGTKPNSGNTIIKPMKYRHPAPLNITISNDTFPEDQSLDSTIAILTADDSGLVFTKNKIQPTVLGGFTLVSGVGSTDNAKFKINKNELVLIAGVKYSTQTTCAIRVKYTNQFQETIEKQFILNVQQVAKPTGFMFEINTTSDNFTLNLGGVLGNKTIEWGDGSSSSSSDAAISHVYQSTGTYTVNITDATFDSEYRSCIFSDYDSRNSVTKVLDWGSLMVGVTNAYDMFYYCQSLTSIPNEWTGWNSVTDATEAFYECELLNTIPASWVGLDSLSIAASMFYATAITTIPSTWSGLLNLTDASYMFCECVSLSAIPTSWVGLGNLTNADYMFNTCESIAAIPSTWSGLNNLLTAEDMFESCYALTSIPPTWAGLETVTSIAWMFCDTPITAMPVAWTQLPAILYVDGAFSGSALTQIPNSWAGLENVTSTRYLFAFNPITAIPPSWSPLNNVTNAYKMFAGCSQLQSSGLPSNWLGLNSLTEMSMMFNRCSSLTYLPDWIGLPNVTRMSQTFTGCTSLVDIKDSFFPSDYATITAIPSVRYVYEMFSGCVNITSNIYRLFYYLKYYKNVMNYSHVPYYGQPSYGGCFTGCTKAAGYSTVYGTLGGNIWCTSSYV